MQNFNLKKYLAEGHLLKEAVIWNWDGDRNSLEEVPPKFKAAVKTELEDPLSDEQFEEAFDAVKNYFADEAGRGSMKFKSDDWAEMIDMDYDPD